MLQAYPVILTYLPDGSPYPYFVTIPDFNINTQGKDLPNAIFMARDAIGLMGIDLEDDNKPLPRPSALADMKHEASETVTLVDIDFGEYRRQNEQRTVRKNCTLPGWLSFEAERAGINFSAVLQNALKQELHLAQ